MNRFFFVWLGRIFATQRDFLFFQFFWILARKKLEKNEKETRNKIVHYSSAPKKFNKTDGMTKFVVDNSSVMILVFAIDKWEWKCLIRVFRQIQTDGFVNSSYFVVRFVLARICVVKTRRTSKCFLFSFLFWQCKKEEKNKQIQRSAEDK